VSVLDRCRPWPLVPSHFDAVALLDTKATPEEVADYKKFVVSVATHAAEAHKEKGSEEPISEAEQAALAAISEALS